MTLFALLLTYYQVSDIAWRPDESVIFLDGMTILENMQSYQSEDPSLPMQHASNVKLLKGVDKTTAINQWQQMPISGFFTDS